MIRPMGFQYESTAEGVTTQECIIRDREGLFLWGSHTERSDAWFQCPSAGGQARRKEPSEQTLPVSRRSFVGAFAMSVVGLASGASRFAWGEEPQADDALL